MILLYEKNQNEEHRNTQKSKHKHSWLTRSLSNPVDNSAKFHTSCTWYTQYKIHLTKYFIMPAGLSWSRYLTFLVTSLASMLAGASVVHNYYKPNLEIPDVLPNPIESHTDREQPTGVKKYISIKRN